MNFTNNVNINSTLRGTWNLVNSTRQQWIIRTYCRVKLGLWNRNEVTSLYLVAFSPLAPCGDKVL
jgi:hypothetical protein